MADVSLRIVHQIQGRSGKAILSVKVDGKSKIVQRIDVADKDERDAFALSVCDINPAVNRDVVDAELARIADEVFAEIDSAEESGTQADRVIALVVCDDVELFHGPGGIDSEGYASITVIDRGCAGSDGGGSTHADARRETHKVRSPSFKAWIQRRYYDMHERCPGSQALTDAIGVIEGMARYDGDEHAVYLRKAEYDGKIYVDLCDERWQVVEIGSSGWRVIESQDVPVRFIRRRGMLPLPAPERDGSLDDLLQVINLNKMDAAHDPDTGGNGQLVTTKIHGRWLLIKAVLVMWMKEKGPFPILIINGVRGSAKTTLCKMLRAVIDPNASAVRRPPKGDRDLMIMANNSALICLDNLSGIKPDLADTLCTVATGGGFGVREHYTDDEEKLFDVCRPILINGIEDLATRADLMDRSVPIALGEITDSDRKDEGELWDLFYELLPGVLGALYEAVATALRRRPATQLESTTRMADFMRFAEAAAPAVGVGDGVILQTMVRVRSESRQAVVDASPVGLAIVKLLESDSNWIGTVGDLLKAINGIRNVSDELPTRLGWPEAPRGLTNALKRIQPDLREVGIEILMGVRRTSKGAMVEIRRVGDEPTRPTRPTRGDVSEYEESVTSSDGSVGTADDLNFPDPDLHTRDDLGDRLSAGCAGGVGSDGAGAVSGIERVTDHPADPRGQL